MNLYEFKCKKVYNQFDEYSFDYQIPAEDECQAHLILGQTFSNIDEYDFVVISWRKVR